MSRDPDTGNPVASSSIRSNSHWRALLNFILRILPLVALAYIGYLISQSDVDWTLLRTSPGLLTVVAIVIILQAATAFLAAYNYVNILAHISAMPIPLRDIMGVYLTSNLYKYLPGNLFHYVGRNSLASAYQIPHKDIAFASLFEAAASVLVVGVISIILGSTYVLALLRVAHDYSPNIFYTILAALCAAGVSGILIYARFHRAKHLVNRLFSRQTKTMWAVAIAVFVFNYFINGFTFLLIVHSLGFEGNMSQILLVLVAYNVAWLAGFVTPGAPGGIGIKEFAIVFILGSIIPESVLLISVIIHRLGLIAADITAYFLSTILK